MYPLSLVQRDSTNPFWQVITLFWWVTAPAMVLGPQDTPQFHYCL